MRKNVNMHEIRQDKRFVRKKAMELRKRPTAAELVFKHKLDLVGIRYRFQWQFYCRGYKGICDFYISSRKLVIEIDGGYHYEPEQQLKDKVRDEFFKTIKNIRVLRISNKTALEMTPQQIKDEVEKYGLALSEKKNRYKNAVILLFPRLTLEEQHLRAIAGR